MRRTPLVLLVAGLVVGIAVPFLWASRIPIFLGAALLVAAGLLSRRAVFAVAGIVAAVVLLLAPGFVTHWRNGRGIAWTVPQGESIELAEAGAAITTSEDDPELRARDIDTGAERWRTRLPAGEDRVRVWRAGRTLVVVGRDDALCRWRTGRSPGRRRSPAWGSSSVSRSPRTRCSTTFRCGRLGS